MVVAGLAFYAISLLLDMCEITGKKVNTFIILEARVSYHIIFSLMRKLQNWRMANAARL